MNISNSRRITKNMMSLFFRMFVTVIVSLYTSRVVLDVLGISDYGLYSVVGGVVALFSFMSASMASSTQRFLNFEKGKGDSLRVEKLFGTSRYVHILLAVVLLIFVEVIGLWILNYKLSIPIERVDAANWIFHLSTASLAISIMNVPYRAAIIANEKMEVFAVLSILEALLKLIIAFSISLFPGDKMIWYGVLILGSTLIVNISYTFYSRRKFPECRGSIERDALFLKSIMTFSSWTLMSGLSVVLRNQGVSILLNIFFGTIVNAAQGIAIQISTIITGFAANFTQAVNPQIVKDYAAGKLEQMHAIVMFSSRISFILLFLVAFPVFVEADFLLKIWLREVPEYTILFTRLILIQVLVESFASVHSTAQGATGKVKLYHFVLSLVGMINLPASYLLLKNGVAPYAVLIVAIIVSAVISIIRLFFLRRSIRLSLKRYLFDVGFRCFGVFTITAPLPLILKINLSNTMWNAIAICALSVALIIVSSFFVGMKTEERNSVVLKIKAKLNLR